jgi:hypothetical protein
VNPIFIMSNVGRVARHGTKAIGTKTMKTNNPKPLTPNQLIELKRLYWAYFGTDILGDGWSYIDKRRPIKKLATYGYVVIRGDFVKITPLGIQVAEAARTIPNLSGRRVFVFTTPRTVRVHLNPPIYERQDDVMPMPIEIIVDRARQTYNRSVSKEKGGYWKNQAHMAYHSRLEDAALAVFRSRLN